MNGRRSLQDANGNRASVRHPNGVTTTCSYDALYRLIQAQTATDFRLAVV